MILPSDLNEQAASDRKANAYLQEFSDIENKFDAFIEKYQLNLLAGTSISFMVHEEQNQYDSLKDVINKYKEAGWFIKTSRSWSARFIDIDISMKEF